MKITASNRDSLNPGRYFSRLACREFATQANEFGTVFDIGIREAHAQKRRPEGRLSFYC